MIILKHLTIERFRLLRSVNLHFPQRGSILIQGPNEAGKSALIESIYFALYGEPLVSRRGNRSLNDLILYGAANATVSLTISVGATELLITRVLTRDLDQQASLLIRRLGASEEETLVDLAAINARIITELGHMNGEALRNSGLIEQKGLTRLENISGSARETTVRNLLGLDMLTELATQFQISPEDEKQLELCSEHLRLAEIQARIPQLDLQLEEIAASLDSVSTNEYLADIEQQDGEISDLEQALDEIHVKRLELRGRQNRVQQLKKADATLLEIVASYDDIAEARREIPLLEQQIADLERREREDLPKIEKRVNDLAELTRSFGTLQRMSNDLLTAVDSIKALEQDLKDYNVNQQDLKALDEQISQTREQLATTQKNLQDLEERRRTVRPQLEDRIQRLNFLVERLATLRSLEDHYTARLASRSDAETNVQQIHQIFRKLQDHEQDLEDAELTYLNAQQEADYWEKAWRQLVIRHHLGEWHRLKGLSLGLTQAEQHVNQARQQHSALRNAITQAHKAAFLNTLYMGIAGLGVLVFIIVGISIFASLGPVAIIAFVLALACLGFIIYQYRNYQKVHIQENTLKVQEQEAISRVSTMVAAREAALRMAGNTDAIYQIENEIRSLEGKVPQSLEEAQQILDTIQDQGDPGEIQQQMKQKVEIAQVARNQRDSALEVVSGLRDERSQLEKLRTDEQWDSIEDDLNKDQVAAELLQQEITLLAGQEGLPLPSITARMQASLIPPTQSFASGPLSPVDATDDITSVPALEDLIASTVKATEHEIVSLDGKLDMIADLNDQARIHHETLDTLLDRQHTQLELSKRYQANDPEGQLEHAREQQMALRSALQSLQDSLRQRVKPLGVIFGQAAIGSAETTARKQLEELHITLGTKIMLQERHQHYTDTLKERQESLSEFYKQLAKFSNTLGSWIVPLNPFAEALVALRARCQKELLEADEAGILQSLENLEDQEKASNVRIQLCQQSILDGHEAISALLAQRKRPAVSNFTRADLITAWPLVDQYGVDDRQRLEDEQTALSLEQADLKQQEKTLRTRLEVGDTQLDLEAARTALAEQEQSYETKKYGSRLLKETEIRLLRKMQPRTKYYMQQILPLLTGGRYHDVHLITEPEGGTISGGTFQIQVWDSAAGDYVSTSALSGGASDQLSLALRLAFAIASLPRDLNAALGFVLLDEPLSSFDRGRAQALVNVVTGDVLSQHFEQTILFSHSSAFDPAMFPYHLYMDNGLVVESNLPVVAAMPVSALPEPAAIPVTPYTEDFNDIVDFDDFDDDDDVTVSVAAIKLPLDKQ